MEDTLITPVPGSQPAICALADASPTRRPGRSLTIQLAVTAAEREAILRLRCEVYAIESSFRASCPTDYRAWEEESDARAAHLYARIGEEVVGALRVVYGADAPFPERLSRAYDLARFASIVPLAKMAITSRFAIKPAWRAGAIALQLFLESARLQQGRGIQLSFGDSPLNLLPFYTSLGFRTYTLPYHHPVAGVLAPFVFVAGDLRHLRQLGSPLLALADERSPGLDETAQRVSDLLAESGPLRGARSDAPRFWQDLQAALGPPQFTQGPLSELSDSELRGLLGLSYLVDWPGGVTLLRRGQPVTERWLVLSGQVVVNGVAAPPLSIIGGPDSAGGSGHAVDAHVGDAGAKLLSLDERKLQQALAAGRITGKLRAALIAPQVFCHQR